MILNERGITLVEVLVAIAVIGIGLTAIASGMMLGTSGITQGQLETTATFLAEQRLEDIKAFALSTGVGQGFDNVINANFPAEDYGTIAGGYNAYRRTTTITNTSATVKRVAVSVFYVPIGVASSNAEREVALTTVLRSR